MTSEEILSYIKIKRRYHYLNVTAVITSLFLIIYGLILLLDNRSDIGDITFSILVTTSLVSMGVSVFYIIEILSDIKLKNRILELLLEYISEKDPTKKRVMKEDIKAFLAILDRDLYNRISEMEDKDVY